MSSALINYKLILQCGFGEWLNSIIETSKNNQLS